MRALLLTVGSQGDVQPFVALASRLRTAGHEAVLAAPACYENLATARDVPFAPLDIDMPAVGAVVKGKHGLRHMLAFTKAMGQRAGAALPALTAVAREGADVVVHHPVLPLGQHLAEWLGVPAVVAPPLPALVPTSDFLSPAWPATVRLPRALNRPSYRVARYLTGAWCRRDIDVWRRDTLGLAPRPARHDPLIGAHTGALVTVLVSVSGHVIPRPADWPATAHLTGYWFADNADDPDTVAQWTPPRRLAEFVGTGEPPVYLGFGSMPIDDPARLAAAIMTATRRTGARFVVASLSPELRRLLPPGHVHVIRQAPHAWLFPRTAAVVHHGGAGTTAAAVAAGRPQVIVPFGIDQHFWASRMTGLGVAVPAPAAHALTGTALARAVDQAMHDQRTARLAADLGLRVRAEDGTGRAVTHLERINQSTKGQTAVPA
jgi:sterol 3beta-glucosyltransferase